MRSTLITQAQTRRARDFVWARQWGASEFDSCSLSALSLGTAEARQFTSLLARSIPTFRLSRSRLTVAFLSLHSLIFVADTAHPHVGDRKARNRRRPVGQYLLECARGMYFGYCCCQHGQTHCSAEADASGVARGTVGTVLDTLASVDYVGMARRQDRPCICVSFSFDLCVTSIDTLRSAC